MSTCVVVRTPSSGARTTCAGNCSTVDADDAAGDHRTVARRFTPWRRHASRRDGEIDGPFLVAGRELQRFTAARAGIIDTVTEAAGTGRHHAGAVWQHHHIPRRREHADEHAPFAEAADAVLTT